jgi:hypothetical protein
MRVSFVVYFVLYVVVEMVGYQLELIGWPRITALDVAAALTNALLWVAVAAAVLVALDVAGARWRRHLRAWEREQAWVASWRRRQAWAQSAWTDAPGWRPTALALPAAAPSSSLPLREPDDEAHVHLL